MPSRREHIWDKHKIIAAIHRSGETLTSIAQQNGISPVTCRVVFLKSQPSAERVISKYLGVDLHDLWPDRYDRDGNRLPSRSNPSRVVTRNKSKKGRAA